MEHTFDTSLIWLHRRRRRISMCMLINNIKGLEAPSITKSSRFLNFFKLQYGLKDLICFHDASLTFPETLYNFWKFFNKGPSNWNNFCLFREIIFGLRLLFAPPPLASFKKHRLPWVQTAKIWLVLLTLAQSMLHPPLNPPWKKNLPTRQCGRKPEKFHC